MAGKPKAALVAAPTPRAVATEWRARLDEVLATLQPDHARTMGEARMITRRRRDLEGAYASAAMALQRVAASAERLKMITEALTAHDAATAAAERQRDTLKASAAKAASLVDWATADHDARDAAGWADLAVRLRSQRWAIAGAVSERASEHEKVERAAETARAEWLALIDGAAMTI